MPQRSIRHWLIGWRTLAQRCRVTEPCAPYIFNLAIFMSRFCALVMLSRLSCRRFVLTTRCCVFLYVQKKDGGVLVQGGSRAGAGISSGGLGWGVRPHM